MTSSTKEVVEGPVPEGTIVDLPMDSISNQDMMEDGEDMDEQRIMVTDR